MSPPSQHHSGYALFVRTKQSALVDLLYGERRRTVLFAEAVANYDHLWQELPAAEKALWRARAMGAADGSGVQRELAAKTTADLSALLVECGASVHRSTADYGAVLARRDGAPIGSAERRRLDAECERTQRRMSAEQARLGDIERAVRARRSETKRKQRNLATSDVRPCDVAGGGLRLLTAAQRHGNGHKSSVVPPPPASDNVGHATQSAAGHSGHSAAAPVGRASGRPAAGSGATAAESPSGGLYDTVLRCLADDERGDNGDKEKDGSDSD